MLNTVVQPPLIFSRFPFARCPRAPSSSSSSSSLSSFFFQCCSSFSAWRSSFFSNRSTSCSGHSHFQATSRLRLLIAIAVFILSCWLMALSGVLSDTFYVPEDSPRLKDRLHSLWSDGLPSWISPAFVDFLTISLIVMTIIRHTVRMRKCRILSIIWSRFLWLVSVLYWIRSIAIIVTTVPPSRHKCIPERPSGFSEAAYWAMLMVVGRRGECTGMIISGHTLIIVSCLMMWLLHIQKNRKKWVVWWTRYVWFHGCITLGLIILTLNHYTIDVFLGVCLAASLWIIYHLFVDALRRRRKLNDNFAAAAAAAAAARLKSADSPWPSSSSSSPEIARASPPTCFPLLLRNKRKSIVKKMNTSSCSSDLETKRVGLIPLQLPPKFVNSGNPRRNEEEEDYILPIYYSAAAWKEELTGGVVEDSEIENSNDDCDIRFSSRPPTISSYVSLPSSCSSSSLPLYDPSTQNQSPSVSRVYTKLLSFCLSDEEKSADEEKAAAAAGAAKVDDKKSTKHRKDTVDLLPLCSRNILSCWAQRPNLEEEEEEDNSSSFVMANFKNEKAAGKEENSSSCIEGLICPYGAAASTEEKTTTTTVSCDSSSSNDDVTLLFCNNSNNKRSLCSFVRTNYNMNSEKVVMDHHQTSSSVVKKGNVKYRPIFSNESFTGTTPFLPSCRSPPFFSDSSLVSSFSHLHCSNCDIDGSTTDSIHEEKERGDDDDVSDPWSLRCNQSTWTRRRRYDDDYDDNGDLSEKCRRKYATTAVVYRRKSEMEMSGGRVRWSGECRGRRGGGGGGGMGGHNNKTQESCLRHNTKKISLLHIRHFGGRTDLGIEEERRGGDAEKKKIAIFDDRENSRYRHHRRKLKGRRKRMTLSSFWGGKWRWSCTAKKRGGGGTRISKNEMSKTTTTSIATNNAYEQLSCLTIFKLLIRWIEWIEVMDLEETREDISFLEQLYRQLLFSSDVNSLIP